MRNTTVSKIVKVLAKLVREPVQEMLKEGFLSGVDARPIYVFRCLFQTKLNGRRWYAPLYRPVMGSFVVKPKAFVAVRLGPRYCDLEYIDPKDGEAVTYTLTAQEWKEKSSYFQALPPDRFRGSLESTVNQLIKLKRSNNNESRRQIPTADPFERSPRRSRS